MAKLKGLRTFKRDIDPDVLIDKTLKIIVQEDRDKIVDAVVESARAGLGPGDKGYPPYSQAYAARFQGTRKNMLDLTGEMLSDKHWLLSSLKTILRLTWSGDDAVGAYAVVHNDGLPIGRGGPRKQREFVHFETSRTETEVFGAYDRAFDRVARDFNRG